MTYSKPRDQKDVMQLVKDYNVKFVRLWFTDILGQLKSFAVPVEELEVAFSEGMGFDGSSIHGFARIDESDMIARPDPTTFAILPWRPKESPVARMFCDIYEPDGTPYKGDPRYILKLNLEKASKKGYTFYLGPELEFFYFKNDKGTETLDEGGYFDYPLDAAEDLRRDTILALEQMGIKVEYSHHEVAPSQHEIDLRYAEALEMADIVMTYRVVVKEIAKQHGVYATFMPKPLFGENGSGMHTHQSLFKGDKNAFFDPKDKYYLSDVAKSYIAGLLTHIKEITLVLNQWVNSYKRLVPGYEAPVYICWARRNRSALIRVPLYKPGKEKATRIELRSPDPACNPYLAFACMLNAGLTGVEKNYKLPEPIEKDVYHLDPEERKALGIDNLPGSLIEAIEYAEKSEILRETLGDHIYTNLIESKKKEWDDYRIRIFPYELERYLPIL
ncbi:MAG: type I glutamate--ammonia ligase [Thermodesulfovibrio sp.]|uniref:type I glutamate--ammonia ligase n=1 Tax=unclassified Thermodesulfovibrio TaxID=2645936 RepID=UPI00083AB52F|nr:MULTISPECIES: type I glutamate--ammonia ligase [unclassified Thermodesulfovibrio]MDI1471170.1 type I glutamate--ammonia ligase [Thermodesulfovibrio sp. 1176]MDI6714025.1 type I glutamate--ammonia ligase [Thermodesulfovibrio sp.]ODA45029.1 Glutamine synthetase type I [Thermodesulfovibrio sp. N1]